MKSERIQFPGAHGLDLAARVDRPADPPKAWALFAHCFTCSKDLKAVSRISRALVERGLGVLRFDFTGLGESEGDFADTNFSTNLQDLEAAVDFMRVELRAPQVLIGHSLGGAAVLSMASDVPEAHAVVTLGAPSDTEHLRDSLLRTAPELDGDVDEAEVQLAGRSFKIKRQFIDDLQGKRVLASVQNLGLPLLILHSPIDEVVHVDHARRIYEAAKHPRSFVSLDSADHLLLKDPADARYVAEVITAWVGRYIEDEVPQNKIDRAMALTLPEGDVRVFGGASIQQKVWASGHRLLADEPERLGGENTGPTPYDLLLAALGTCTNMTLRMYADRKGWPLTEVGTQLRHSKVDAADCDDCETTTGKVDLIEREIELRGDLDEAQLKRLMEIADRCPVHRSLKSETVVRSRQV
ncbi:MAG: alpha/beta fold hydrolase [Acidobacteriota bacterium]